jgi:DNA-binding NarL/FixJ family response regulator
MSEGRRVMIVDDHELLAGSLRAMLTAEGFEVVVPRVEPAAVYAAADAMPPDVVLLDLDLGEQGGDGGMLVEGLAVGGARVIVVTGSHDRLRIAACLESGACGHLDKSAPIDRLLDAVRVVAAGGEILADADRQDRLAELRGSRARRGRELAPFTELTNRERFVLVQIIDGRSATEIAASSYVSEATVRSQIRSILSKLGVRSQLAAVALARQVAWRPPSGDGPGEPG